MADVRNSHGYFDKGNKLGRGRPKGSRNKPLELRYLNEVLRYGYGRRFRRVSERLTEDLGGDEFLSTAEKILIQRCAMLATECERMEREALSGRVPLDATVYSTLTGQLTRTLNTVGTKRLPRDVTPPTLRDYIEAVREPEIDEDSDALSGQSPAGTPGETAG
jgi:hypothetical protein